MRFSEWLTQDVGIIKTHVQSMSSEDRKICSLIFSFAYDIGVQDGERSLLKKK